MTAMCTCAWRWTGTEWVRLQIAGCGHHPAEPVLEEICRRLGTIEKKLESIMTAQQDIDAAVATDTVLLEDLTTQTQAVSAAQADLAQYIKDHQNDEAADTSALNAINAKLQAAQPSLDAAVTALVNIVPPADSPPVAGGVAVQSGTTAPDGSGAVPAQSPATSGDINGDGTPVVQEPASPADGDTTDPGTDTELEPIGEAPSPSTSVF